MAKTFLATTALEEFWDDRLPILFLEEWCLLHRRRHVWNALEHRLLPPSWSNQGELGRARTYLQELYEDVLVRLSAALGNIHARSRSSRYWRILLGPWLYAYLCMMHERYGSLRRALDMEHELTTIGLDSACFVTPTDTNEFIEWLKDDAYNLQIYTRLWQAMGMNFPVKPLAENRRPISEPVTHSSESVPGKFLRLILGGSRKIVLYSSYFPLEFQIRLAIQTAGKVIPIRSGQKTPSTQNIDHPTRRTLASALPTNNSFEMAVARLFAADIPRCFLEDFATIADAARRYFPRSPKAILSASWLYNEPFKLWAAEAQELGTSLLCSQHGGIYGLLNYVPYENHELAIADRFYSWGWTSDVFHEKIVPLPGGKLMGRKTFGANKRRRGILWAATQAPRYPVFPFGDRFSEYLAWQARFLAAFPVELRNELRLRLHREDGGWDILQRLSDQGFTVQTEDWSRPFYRSLSECRLYVCDHLSTTFIEALSADKPTVLFWSAQATPLRPEAIPYCENLKSVGILFETPEKAAAAIRAGYDDVEDWWRDPHRQEVRRSFCFKFGRTSIKAEAEWAQELIRWEKKL